MVMSTLHSGVLTALKTSLALCGTRVPLTKGSVMFKSSVTLLPVQGLQPESLLGGDVPKL